MDRREADLPADNPDSNLHRSFNATTSSSSSSPPDFLRNVQAAFKRHRMMPPLNHIQPRRLVVRGELSKSSDPVVHSKTTVKSSDVSLSKRVQDPVARTTNMVSSTSVSQEDASVTPSSISAATNNEGNSMSIDAQRCQPSVGTGCRSSNMAASSCFEGEHVSLVDGTKKVQFALEKNTGSHEMECVQSNQLDGLAALSQDGIHQNFQNLDVDPSLKTSDKRPSFHPKRMIGVENQIKPFRNFLQSDFGHHMTQSSVVGSSCATTTLVNSESAPMLNSTTHCSRDPHRSFHASEYSNPPDQPIIQANTENPSKFSPKCHNKVSSDHLGSLFPSASVDSHLEKRCELSKDQQGKEEGYCGMTKDPPPLADKSTKVDTFAGDITDIQSQAPMSSDCFSDVKTGPSKSEKREKADANKNVSAPRKRNYDPDLFFKVNGKLYQRLGKIGSGGSSEVHKVISQDCTIYALKKIKLKGRDYATAFGFCQEIEYLNKLKGRDHIIQLIDYEVTDKALLKEVMSGSVSNKDGRVKDDGYIYMVLEYGEIDLAHMLSHKWKELDKSNMTIDENWLRFYWQQILLAVKTIHEERIVHSDLKPANFLLVRGSLKLIDFGIAKAIMSDTTNIQRDSQVGTLSYMSPEAFMCNETDPNGNTIKCGRPSDIWSLGCILYQMVYGKTPFADFKTFWAKFKVVTDPTYKIQYGPVSNPWLLDLMTKCLAWDRNERWRIPQLLQHPFLVPPVIRAIMDDDKCKFLKVVYDSCVGNGDMLRLCGRLDELLRDPREACVSELLGQVSKLCVEIKERLVNSE